MLMSFIRFITETDVKMSKSQQKRSIKSAAKKMISVVKLIRFKSICSFKKVDKKLAVTKFFQNVTSQ